MATSCSNKSIECFRSDSDEKTGTVASYQLHIGTEKFPVGIIPYVAHRSHAVPSSIHIAVEGGHWWLSFAAEDPRCSDARENGRRRNRATCRGFTASLDEDRGVAKPLMTSDGQVFDLKPIQKARIGKARHHRKTMAAASSSAQERLQKPKESVSQGNPVSAVRKKRPSGLCPPNQSCLGRP
jgi:putative transposase